MGQAITHLNYSRARLFWRCMRRFFFRYILRLIPKTEDLAFAIGTAAHAGLAAHYRGEESAPEKAAHVYLVRRMEWWKNPVLEEWKEDAGYVATMVDEYAKRDFPKDDFEVKEVEKPFCVEIAPGLFWCGTTDLEVERFDHLAIMDHKTTRNTPDEGYLSLFSRSFQLLGYVTGRMLSTGREIREFAVNALQKAKTLGKEESVSRQCPDCHNGKKKKLTCKTCLGQGRVEKKVPLQPFRRMWFPVVADDLARFRAFALRTFEQVSIELSRLQEGKDAFPMNDAMCYDCPYQALCWELSPEQWKSPPPEYLTDFDVGKEDYVDVMATEENV